MGAGLLMHLSAHKRRIAFFSTNVFLRLNGWKMEVEASRANDFIVGLLTDGRVEFGRIAAWIRSSIVRSK